VLQLFSVSEIAEKLGKTSNSVYKKINRLKVELEPHKQKAKGVIYYDVEGFEIIKDSYREPHKAKVQGESRLNTVDDNLLNLLLLEKDNQISHLKEELAKKDKSLSKALELANQTQHLLAIEKQHVLQLQEPQKKSFWDRFRKSKLNEKWNSNINE
jgi:predicted DNA-binding protein YlxM (UPF0122 family)